MFNNRERNIILTGDIEANNSIAVCANLLDLDSEEEITLFINSAGGSINAGYAIIDVMHALDSPVNIVAIGYVASMATSIMALGEKGRRYAYSHTVFLIHNPRTKTEGNYGELKVDLNHLLKTEKSMITDLAKATGQTKEQITKDFKLERTFTAKEAKKYGLIDHII